MDECLGLFCVVDDDRVEVVVVADEVGVDVGGGWPLPILIAVGALGAVLRGAAPGV